MITGEGHPTYRIRYVAVPSDPEHAAQVASTFPASGLPWPR